MLRVLVKKQLSEVFKSYFYDAKKNKMRSKWAVAGWFVFFVVIMVGVLGGMFTALSLSMCGALTQAGAGWLYFLLIGNISVLLGAFGSVFNTYSGLYLAKDNDLLLSLPIPVRTIVAARLWNVYLLGAMYSATALLPALIVYWITAGVTAARVICGLALLLIVTALVLLLSCLLGWVVAKISLRLKHKSFAAVLVSLLFIGGYYFCYFKANDFIQDVIRNAAVYGEKIRGTARGLYLFGRVGEGDWAAAALFLAVTAALLALMWHLLSRSFLNIATSSGRTEKVRYVEKPARTRTPFRALLGKELARFTASANYMLNCGLGIILIPLGGVALLFRGRMLFGLLDEVFASRPGTASVLLCTMLCMLSSMNNMATPSVSLEGKSIWIPQSLPVEPKTVLRAKASAQLLLTGIPVLFGSVCAAAAAETTLPVRLLMVAMTLAYTAFSALFAAVMGVRMPLLNWTSELAPIKQSGAILVVIFSAWIFSVVLAGLYMFLGYKIGAAPYLGAWTAVFAVGSLLLLRWMDTKGAETFAAL